MLQVLCVAGLVYTIASGFYIRRFFRDTVLYSPDVVAEEDGASILKPLHGAEPGLRQHLESFLNLDKSGPTQVVFGLQSADDTALPIAEALKAEHGHEVVVIHSNPRLHGQNRKISNVLNMMAAAEHPIIVLSDSDIGVRPDYLERVRAALAQPGVGVVTCPYYGEGRAGFWSGLAAMGLSYQFLPNVITGVSLRLAEPCMGSTIAIRRETLGRIGGFEAFRDVLADDYAIGAAVRKLGLKSVVAPILVSHGSVETPPRRRLRPRTALGQDGARGRCDRPYGQRRHPSPAAGGAPDARPGLFPGLRRPCAGRIYRASVADEHR